MPNWTKEDAAAGRCKYFDVGFPVGSEKPGWKSPTTEQPTAVPAPDHAALIAQLDEILLAEVASGGPGAAIALRTIAAGGGRVLVAEAAADVPGVIRTQVDHWKSIAKVVAQARAGIASGTIIVVTGARLPVVVDGETSPLAAPRLRDPEQSSG